MKRIGNLYETIISLDTLHEGYLAARKGKRSCRSVYEFEKHLGKELNSLHNELKDESYTPKAYNRFFIYEPKKREISAPAFRDRVVQHALYNVVRPIFDATFISTSFACRPGKGTHAAADYVQRCLQIVPKDSYFLQLDIHRYYYQIDHDVLHKQISRKIKDKSVANLWMKFASLPDQAIGLPIGCLMSQLNGLIYLNYLDQFVKRDLKVKHYVRYVDDFILIGLTKEQATNYYERINDFLKEQLKLKFSKVIINKITRGINFVGYRTWRKNRFIRKRALYIFKRAMLNENIESIVSSLGHARKTGSLRHMLKLIRINYDNYHQLPKIYR